MSISWQQQNETRLTLHTGTASWYYYWAKHNAFCGLFITTTLSSVLLAADVLHWAVSESRYHTIVAHRASVGLTVQVLYGLLGLFHVTVVCRLINYATRLRMNKSAVSLDILRTWVDMSLPRIYWDLPLRYFFPLALVVVFSIVPSALWAGAVTPTLTEDTTLGVLWVPSYGSVSMIKEYPSEIGAAESSLRAQQGFFTYSVGTRLTGDLLSSAASATTVDNSPRIHSKLDNTQFHYIGCSYGVGAAIGLSDYPITGIELATGYTYQEASYLANVSCIYNSSTNFLINDNTGRELLYAAAGNLPDSVESPEYSNYVGYSESAIVAIGVAHSELSPRRFMAITAGESYAFLNATQCTLDFAPTLFNISVNLPNRTTAVTPDHGIPDFNVERNLTRTVVRQLELISNDLTNLCVSLLGDALNSSIGAWNISQGGRAVTEAEATLAGLTNSVIAMTDDMTAAYASAQLMVGRFSVEQTAVVQLSAARFGQTAYVYAIFGLNLAILLIVVAEAVRTSGWKDLGQFNHLDI
ncbi:hypothetical protein AOQ84DRAFT_408733 [Glonium stellatum]|uniref:Transmembrane protein n=1 Tax=Glonium stellatum TaxID=574774 RepID=A0A8E2EZ42_9PEZI|nr:hypothetical protein AOQ84DRAFT_408733 [Glonium stellatum]